MKDGNRGQAFRGDRLLWSHVADDLGGSDRMSDRGEAASRGPYQLAHAGLRLVPAHEEGRTGDQAAGGLVAVPPTRSRPPEGTGCRGSRG